MKLFLLQLGMLRPMGVPIVGYLVETDDGRRVLIDSGFPERFIDEPPGPQGPAGLEVDMQPEDFVVRRLSSIGIRAEDVDYLICTHFDADHAGNHDLFPNAELVVQRKHYEAAIDGHERSAVVRDHWDLPRERYQLVDGDIELLPGVELIETSGHVPGHQSVLVRLPETGPVLLAIDAIPAAVAQDPDSRPIFPNDEDEESTRESTRKLARITESESVALTVFGHDPRQWPDLKHAPEYYR